jgi:hypothetical protein
MFWRNVLPPASGFEEKAEQASNRPLLAADGSSMILQNISKLIPD